MDLFRKLSNSFIDNKERPCLFIDGHFYSYSRLSHQVNKIRHAIRLLSNETENIIGLVDNNDLETYASIFALWFEGKAYLPLNPQVPKERNLLISREAGILSVLDSSEHSCFSEYKIISTRHLKVVRTDLPLVDCSDNEIAYLLFTSGTTGTPKGVPITRKNLTGFINAFDALGLKIEENDRVLQMFDLTFDLSVMSFLVPLINGACLYTIPRDEIKYIYIAQLMQEQQMTVALMVPSVLQNLRPYFKEMKFGQMKISLFCGEALPLDLTEKWSECVPNSKILNVYGPTECTIFCTRYEFEEMNNCKSHNGIVSLGKPMKGTDIIIIDENRNILESNQVGELCLSGLQLTAGYWNNSIKNQESFFELSYRGNLSLFYKTGDLCYLDKDGDLFYLGRLDHQIKIQGFRVELSEIEYHCKTYLNANAVALSYKNKIGNTEVGLVIESNECDTMGLFSYLKRMIPAYMVPSKVHLINKFPLNDNGKTNRKAIKQTLEKKWMNTEYVQ